METFLLAIHVITAVLIVLVVLLQSGKSDLGSAFGAGTSQSVFGASGAGNLLTKITMWAAAVFAVTSMSITIYQSRAARKSIFDEAPVQQQVPVAPQAPAAGAAPTPTNPAAPAPAPSAEQPTEKK